ncbi:MAG: hypothetical protein KGL57_12380, partial [Burkholderiales bacterium]|nr:hypothetical protein [Burkholderiales bacterium]
MTTKMIRQALAVAAIAATLPLQAHASGSLTVNTAVPTGSLIMSNNVDSTDWLAERFTVSASTQIDSINAYLLSADTSGADIGKTFTIALYGDSTYAGKLLPSLNFGLPNHGQLFQTSATYTADGWNGSSGLNWSIAAGSYWVALEVGSDPSNASFLQAPTGAQPVAEAVAFFDGSGTRYQSTDLS